MRHVDLEILQERKKRILQAVIHHYIKTAKPVGSSSITKEYDFDLSPATIRHLMSELEEEGCLTHPHTSAGRVPTDKGYRSYVDSLIELQKLALDEEDRVRHEYYGRIRELEDLLTKTSHALSALSHYTGFVVTPKAESSRLKHIQLTKVSENQLLVILVTHSGLVKHKIIESDVTRDKLPRLNRILNDNLKDLTLSNVKRKVIDLLEEFERQEHEILSLAKSLSSHIFDLDEEIYIEGTSNVLELPEFHDYESIRCLLTLSEDRERLIDIVNENLGHKGIKVLIGSESCCQDLKQLSVISSIYENKGRPMGVLGIIGPKRMEYSRMMALVNTISVVVNKLLNKLGG